MNHTKVFFSQEEKFQKSENKDLIINLSEKLKGKTFEEIKEILSLMEYYIKNNFTIV